MAKKVLGSELHELIVTDQYWRDCAMKEFTEKEDDIFTEFLAERDDNSAWIESQVTNIGFEEIFEEPMYITSDAVKYGIKQDILAEASQNSRLYAVVRGKHYPVGLSATEGLINYSKLTREGYIWMRKINPVCLKTAINNGINCIGYDDSKSGKCLIKIGDEMVRSVVTSRYAPMPSSSLFGYASTEYFPDNWPKASFLKGYWTHERVQGVWSLAEYRNKFMQTIGQAVQIHDYFPALSIENSDTTASAIRVRPIFLREDGTELPLLNGTRTTHIGAQTIHERLEADFEMVLAGFLDAEKRLLSLASIDIEHGYNAVTRCLKQPKVTLPATQAREAADMFRDLHGDGPCSALDVYLAVADAYNFVCRDFPNDKMKLVRASDAVIASMNSPWKYLDTEEPAQL